MCDRGLRPVDVDADNYTFTMDLRQVVQLVAFLMASNYRNIEMGYNIITRFIKSIIRNEPNKVEDHNMTENNSMSKYLHCNLSLTKCNDQAELLFNSHKTFPLWKRDKRNFTTKHTKSTMISEYIAARGMPDHPANIISVDVATNIE